MSFHIGEQVVCIVRNSGWYANHDGSEPISAPIKGRIYTVAAVLPGGANDPAEVYLAFEEIAEEWEAYGFRPVKKTSIDIFTSMLTPAPKVKEPV